MWLGSMLLLALAVFIVWDSRRLRAEAPERLPRARLKRGFLPRGLVRWHAYLALSGVLAVFSYIEWAQPSLPPYTGRWSWLYRALFDVLGERGLLIWWALWALFFFGYGVLLLRREKGKRHDA